MSRIAELKALAEKPTETWLADLEHHAEGVRRAMEAIHGGTWSGDVNHEHCFVLISREIEEAAA